MKVQLCAQLGVQLLGQTMKNTVYSLPLWVSSPDLEGHVPQLLGIPGLSEKYWMVLYPSRQF